MGGPCEAAKAGEPTRGSSHPCCARIRSGHGGGGPNGTDRVGQCVRHGGKYAHAQKQIATASKHHHVNWNGNDLAGVQRRMARSVNDKLIPTSTLVMVCPCRDSCTNTTQYYKVRRDRIRINPRMLLTPYSRIMEVRTSYGLHGIRSLHTVIR